MRQFLEAIQKDIDEFKNPAPIVSGLYALIFAAIITFYPEHPDRFRFQASLALMGVGILWAKEIADRVKFPLLIPALAYFCWNGFNVFATRYSPYKSLSVQFDGPSAHASFLMVLVVSFFALSRYPVRLKLFRVFEMICLLDAVLMIMGHTGVLDNQALDATLIAMIYPSILLRDDEIWESAKTKINGLWSLSYYLLSRFIPPIAVLFFSQSATGVFCLIGGFLAMGLLAWEHHLVRWIYAGGAFLAFVIGYLTQSSRLFSSTGRWGVWEWFVNWIWDTDQFMYGTGMGTFEVLGGAIQRNYGFDNSNQPFWLYAHNEYLQIAFETGLVGLGLALLPMLFLGWVSFRKRSWTFPALVAIAIGGLSQSPLRILVMSIWVCLIVREAIWLNLPLDIRSCAARHDEVEDV